MWPPGDDSWFTSISPVGGAVAPSAFLVRKSFISAPAFYDPRYSSAVTVGVFKSSAAAPPGDWSKERAERKEVNRRQDRVDGVSWRNDGTAGTCSGKRTNLVRCHERGAEYSWSLCCLLRPGLSGCSSPRFESCSPPQAPLAARSVSRCYSCCNRHHSGEVAQVGRCQQASRRSRDASSQANVNLFAYGLHQTHFKNLSF